MARQTGIIKLRGTLGGITFYRTSQDGDLAREKGGVDATRIATDPAFARTRENGAEFGRAGAAGKLLRKALRNLLQNAADRRVTSRLTQEMVKVVKADATSERGLRNVLDGELELLTGFEFNINGKLSTTLFAAYVATLDRVTGEAKVTIPAFTPTLGIAAPAGATHFKINIAAAAIDFELGTIESLTDSTDVEELSNVALAAQDLSVNLPVNSTHPLFLALGIEFFQEVNGQNYSLRNGAYNGLALVKILGV
ncbi:MAG TPA: hypothetical protein VGE26_08335 [Sphingobacteriaceae bacterium]